MTTSSFAGPPDSEVALEATDPLERSAQTFPHLSDRMIRRVAAYGDEIAVEAGTHLFDRGQRGVDFYLVLSGSIGIIGRGHARRRA